MNILPNSNVSRRINFYLNEMHNAVYIFIVMKKYRLAFFVVAQKILRKVFKYNLTPPLPIQVNIETTSVCNLQCPVCPTGDGSLKRDIPIMSFEVVKKIIDDIKSFTGRVYLHNYGEPFMNKDLIKMIRYTKDAGMYVKLSTNGEFFYSKEFARKVVQSGIDYMFVSVDGKDQETHEKYRIGSKFHKVTRGLKFITEAKNELKSATPKIEIQFLVTKHNEHQRGDMKQFAQQVGANVYAERIFGACSGDKEEAGKWISDDPESTLLRVDEKTGTVDYAGEYLSNCNRLYTYLVVNSDGSVSPCIEDPYVVNNMGNVHEQSIRDIWKGSAYKELRNKIKLSRKDIPNCNSCSYGKTKSKTWKTEHYIKPSTSIEAPALVRESKIDEIEIKISN